MVGRKRRGTGPGFAAMAGMIQEAVVWMRRYGRGADRSGPQMSA